MPWHPCPETVCLFTLFCLTCQKVVRKRREIGQLRFPCWAGPRLFSIFGPSIIPGSYCLNSRRQLSMTVGVQVLSWVSECMFSRQFVCLFILLEGTSRRKKLQGWWEVGDCDCRLSVSLQRKWTGGPQPSPGPTEQGAVRGTFYSTNAHTSVASLAAELWGKAGKCHPTSLR